MRRLLVITTAVLIMGLALPALAHNFQGEGDCDSWTLQLDGTWNATEIFVDEVSVGLEQTITIPDTSDTTERTFVVRWDKPTDVIVDHTLERDLDGCEETTTTTSSIPDDTTTTLPEEESTTTTIPATSTTQTAPTSTLPAPTTTVPGLTEATFTATRTCISEGMGEVTITVDWTGVERVDFLLLDPQYGDWVLYTFTEADGSPIRKLSDVAALFEVRGYPADGFTFENANQPDGSLSIYVDIEACESRSTATTVPPATSIAISTSETLPFTDNEETAFLALAAAGLLGLGAVLVLTARREVE